MKLSKFGSQSKEAGEQQNSYEKNTQNAPVENVGSLPTVIGADGIAVVSLNGKIDAMCFASIQEYALSLLDRNDVVGIVFDMKDVSYVSSAGLRMFAVVHKKAISVGKSYKLTQIRGDIFKLFQMTGYASAFSLEVQSEE